jgi:hypothetical protein
VVGQQADGGRGDALAPVAVTQPIANFGVDALDIGVQDVADAAGDVAVHLDGQERPRRHHLCAGDERSGIVDRIRMRKGVAQTEPDPAIVGLHRQRRGIVIVPVAHDDRPGPQLDRRHQASFVPNRLARA